MRDMLSHQKITQHDYSISYFKIQIRELGKGDITMNKEQLLELIEKMNEKEIRRLCGFAAGMVSVRVKQETKQDKSS